MGVAIISDIFMGAIDRITSKRARKWNSTLGRYSTETVWNPTVANLTLMALGSSAPEILLNVIETTCVNAMFSGDLGPSVIVGSAAFNLLIIIAICVATIPDGEVRKIKETQVYLVTATFSIFAYAWLLLVLKGFSPNVVEPWEGIFTFLFFPILVFVAYLADRGHINPFGSQKLTSSSKMRVPPDITKMELAELEVQIRREFGSITDDMVSKIITLRSMEGQTRAHYVVAATRKLFGGRRVQCGNAARTSMLDVISARSRIVPVEAEVERLTCAFTWEHMNYHVIENAGFVSVKVIRSGFLDIAASVQYQTRDGTAKADSKADSDPNIPNPDYIHKEGELVFSSGEVEKQLEIQILDDNAYEEKEEFYIDLTNPRIIDESTENGKDVVPILRDAVTRQEKSKVTTNVTIIDDDSAGVIAWSQDHIHVRGRPDDFEIVLEVERKHGTKGAIVCDYTTENHTALAGTDYVSESGTVTIEEGVTSAHIPVKILARGRYGTTDCFRVILTDVKGNGAKFDDSTDGGADSCILTVYLCSDTESMQKVDRLFGTLNRKWEKAKIGHSSWKDQFVDAFYVNGGEGDDDDDDECVAPGFGEYFGHFIGLPWKLVFALCPPVDYCGGWLCFWSSLLMIGAVTVVIGDLANLFGCVLPFMENEITAITFVALGTSLPDTFASKTAAEQDPYADASVGNVTGSNSVNIFLGLGLPWMMASLYWKFFTSHSEWDKRYQNDADLEWLGPMGQRHPHYIVKAGSLFFSVAVFACCGSVCICILYIRRKLFGGELGGPKGPKYITAFLLVCLWVLYIALSILNLKGVI